MGMCHCGSLLCGTGQFSVGPPRQFSAVYSQKENTRVIAVERNCVVVVFFFYCFFFLPANADQTCRLNV